MQIEIHTDGMELSGPDREYVQEKVNHLSDFAGEMQDESVHAQIRVSLDTKKSKTGHVSMEVTVYAPGAIIRAEVYGTTVYEATDIAFEKMKRQVEKYKSKKHRRDQEGDWIPTSTLEEISEKTGPENNDPQVLKRKKIKDLNLMHEDEALHQMELLGHDFFVYKNIDSGDYNILYKRHSGGYGAMELE